VARAGPAAPMAGVVLCGGRSTRMGTDKALLEMEGRPLVVHVAARLARVADPVFLASGHPGGLPQLGELPYPEVADEVAAGGPLAGLVAGLAASPRDLTAILAVDMPFASPAVFLLLAGGIGSADAAVPVTENGPQPLHAVYARAALPALREALAHRRLALRAALACLRVRLVPEAEWRRVDPTRRFAANLNTAQDLSMLRGSDAEGPSV
jgi:molybdopterin-guanine dinucleotide biosynthesis protein A